MIENAKLLQAIQNIINQSYSSGDEYSYRGGRDWYNKQAEGNDFHKLVRARDAMKKGDYDKYADFVAALVGASNDYTNPKHTSLASPKPARAEDSPSPVMRGKNDWSNPKYMSPYEPAARAMTAYEMADTYAERHARQPQAKPVNTAQTTSSVEMKSDTVPKSPAPSYDDVHHDVMMRGGSFPVEIGDPISAQLRSEWLYSYPEAPASANNAPRKAKKKDGILSAIAEWIAATAQSWNSGVDRALSDPAVRQRHLDIMMTSALAQGAAGRSGIGGSGVRRLTGPGPQRFLPQPQRLLGPPPQPNIPTTEIPTVHPGDVPINMPSPKFLESLNRLSR